ncbi:histidinol phosphate phosphatase domain-containing protein [Desulfohalobium retbaense]|uniref:PHP domain protein n=1 Tax=Desulfohalobium retbaense (strain ATCC 49708 / DSM 5692 / JCM 16813 / HR100) TaxID=485915 RepID=C8X376_DESRD|nr:histidinol phosphate phosphatase domain-containing protein [Desulfohalobium retbaense]ACV68873.1 PHP domain protein [Desulfohalobium retbaense DSM 5692]
MIDLHTHTVFSDGELIPAELARRARVAGYRAVAMTDHADASNLQPILDNVGRMVRQFGPHCGIELFFGVELTHVPPALIPDLVAAARDGGAQLVVVHGETLVEPVEEGTNLAAIEAGVDILAHPGLIRDEEARLAAERGVALEITTRKGHSLTNGHVAVQARHHGARLVINNDAHGPSDFVDRDLRRGVALGAGLSQEEYHQVEENSRYLVSRILQAGTR